MTVTPSLNRNSEFLKLWFGQTISVFGSQITGLALPLTAVLILNATPSQMGVLSALTVVPFILVGLFAGVWADRVRRRPILMAADFGRFVLLIAIPIAALNGFLSMTALYVIVFLIGVMTVFFDVSYQAFLPSLVGREQLVEGNSKLEISNSAAAILGPGLAGLLIQVLTAPIAVAFDALSFLASALSLGLIRSAEPPSPPRDQSRNIFHEIADGLRLVLGNRLLWSIAACTGTANLCFSIWQAVYINYLSRELHLPPVVQGLIFAAGAPGALAAALVSARLTQRLRFGRALIVGILLWSTAPLLVLVQGPIPLVAGLMIVSGFLSSFGSVLYNVNQVSLRQTITPDHLLGRVVASMRFIVSGAIPIGALMGGALGDAVGLRPTMVIGILLGLGAFLWIFFSPVRHLKEVPSPADSVPSA